jgi:hypothetical protein
LTALNAAATSFTRSHCKNQLGGASRKRFR